MNLFNKLALLYISTVISAHKYIIKIFTGIFFNKRETYKKILINRDGAFGDSIVALPALSIIRQNFPRSQIDLLTVSNGGITFRDLGIEKSLINNFYIIKKSERKSYIKKLSEEQYDLFIQLPQNLNIYKSIRNILLVRFGLNIKSAFGWDHGRIKSFVRQQKLYSNITTETQRFIMNMSDAGIQGEINYPIKAIKPESNVIKDLLMQKRPIVFIIGGKLQPKKWPLDNWVALANLIGQNHHILIIGGKDEVKDANYILSKSKNVTSLCDKLAIPELFYVLKKTHLAISLDTGAMHLCDASGTKTIALISTRELTNKWHPNNKDSVVIEKILPCSFCFKRVCFNNICMKNITAEEVYAEFLKIY